MLHFLFTQDSCPDVPLNSQKKRQKKKTRTRRGSGSYWHSAVLDLQSKFEPEQHLCSLSLFLMYLFHVKELKWSVKNVPLPLIWSPVGQKEAEYQRIIRVSLLPETRWRCVRSWDWLNMPKTDLLQVCKLCLRCPRNWQICVLSNRKWKK